MTIGFIGNPNCGKTTLFNAYTGANLKVANWPGVTVEKKEGAMKYHNQTYKLVDLPGTYSLTSYTIEEIVSRNYILSDEVDVLINVVNGSSLERNLYLTLQLIELGKPLVVALNMMDIVEKRGMEIDLHRLPEMLGVPVIPVSARKRKGLEVLIHAAVHHSMEQPHQHFVKVNRDGSKGYSEVPVTYSKDIEAMISIVSESLKKKYKNIKNERWHAIKLLEHDDEIMKKYPVEKYLTKTVYETQITRQKYAYIETILEEVIVGREKVKAKTDMADKILTHRILGLPIFFAIMGLMFFLTFTLGDWLKGFFEIGIEYMTETIDSALVFLGANDILHSLIVDGIIAGVGGILSFLPNIFILFLALAFLEDSGYMSRVAYIMNGIMGKLGVSGKAFIPMLLGFGCSVPAVMATRSLENQKDRLRIMAAIPFMSCGAKLPIYILFSGMFFPEHDVWVSFSIYLTGMFIAILSLYIMHKISGKKEENLLLIELPEYKAPSAHTVSVYVWDKIKDYLSRAATVILAASVVMWVIMNFGFSGYTKDISESFGAVLGRYLVPVLSPVGLGWWQAAVAIISGISAKEVVVASFAVLFNISNLSSPEGINALLPALSSIGFGQLNAFSLMIFCLLYPPCLSALVTIKRESGSWKTLLAMAAFQTCTAWAASFLVFQIGSVFQF